MKQFKKRAHAVWQCKYHVVWCPKYRFRVFKRRTRQIASRDNTTALRVAKQRDCGGNYPDRPYPFGPCDPSEIFSFRGHRVFEGQKRYQDFRCSSWAKKALLGPALLGKRVLCQHHRSWWRTNHTVCALAIAQRSKIGSNIVMVTDWPF